MLSSRRGDLILSAPVKEERQKTGISFPEMLLGLIRFCDAVKQMGDSFP